MEFYSKFSPKLSKTIIFHKNHTRVVSTLSQGCAEVVSTLARPSSIEASMTFRINYHNTPSTLYINCCP